jgi:hypothetical protein
VRPLVILKTFEIAIIDEGVMIDEGVIDESLIVMNLDPALHTIVHVRVCRSVCCS